MKYIATIILVFFSFKSVECQTTTTWQYGYDDFERLIRSSINDITIEYCYDPLGNRTCRVITGGNQVTIDLTPTDGAIVNQASVGGAITGTYTSNNLGADASGSFTTYYVLSLNGTYEPGQDILLRSVQTPSLVGGAMVTVELGITVPNTVVPGSYQLLIIQDPGGLVEELSETNNILAWPITVQDCAGDISLSTSTSTANCGGTTGASVSASGGTGPYTYEWSTVPEQEGAMVTGLSAGTYTITVTDALGCVLIETYEVLEGETDPVANFGYSRDGLTVTFSETSVGAATYSWDFGDGGSSSSANPAHTFSVGGSYEICLTVGNGCGTNMVCQNLQVNNSGCPIPSNLSVTATTTTSASLSWNNNQQPTQIEYSTDGATWVLRGPFAGGQATLTGLTENTSYEWRARSTCGSAISLWSSSAFFSTQTSGGGNTGNDIAKTFTVPVTPRDEQVGWGNNGAFYYSWTEGDDFLLAKFDNLGESLWTRRLTGWDMRDNHKVIGTNDGGALCVVQIREGDDYGALLKFNQSGQLSWSKTITYPGTSLETELFSAVEVNGGFVFVGYVERLASTPSGTRRVESTLMGKVNSSGSLLWSRVATPSQDIDQYFIDVAEDASGNLYAVGHRNNNGIELLVVKTDGNGQQLARSGFRGAANDRFNTGEIAVVNNSGNPGGINGVYLRFRSIIQGNSNLSGHTVSKLSTSSLSPVWTYGYGSSSDGRITIDETNGTIYVSHVDRMMTIGQNGDPVLNKLENTPLGIGFYDGIFNGTEVVFMGQGGTSFGIILADAQLKNTCALEDDNFPPLKMAISPTVTDVMDGTWEVGNFLSSQIVSATVSSRNTVMSDACGPVCEAQASIQNASSVMCIGDSQTLYSTSTGATNLEWTNLTTGISLGNSPSIDFTPTDSGTTTIQLEASVGEDCIDIVTVSITVNELPQVQVETTASTCGQFNGMASVNLAAGAIANWSTGETGANITGLSEGNYFVEVTAPTGCSTIQNFTIENIGFDFTVETIVYDVTCAGANDGNIEVVPIGAADPVTYAWSGGNTGFSGLMGVGPGDYAFTITDANGCTFTSAVTVEEPDAISVDSTVVVNSACEFPFNGQITVNPQGGTPPYSYQWSGRSETTNSLIGLESYDGSVTITDASGCTYVSDYFLPELMEPCLTFYADADGDGYGDPNISIVATAAPMGYVDNNGDCDDDNPAIYPMQVELCDGVDGNCNGMEDEPCDPGCPDLTLTDLELIPQANGDLTIRYTMRNIGTAPADFQNTSIIIQAYRLVDTMANVGIAEGGFVLPFNGPQVLSPGEQWTFTFGSVSSAANCNEPYVGVTIDLNGMLTECNEENNWVYLRRPNCPEATCDDGLQNGDETGIDCGGPDCLPCAIGGSAIVLQDSIAEAGGEVSYEVVVNAGAEVELLIDNIPAGTFTGNSGLLTLSKPLPGVHYLRLMEGGQEIDRAVVRFESCRWTPYFMDGTEEVLLDRCVAIKNSVAYVPSLLYPVNSTLSGRSGFVSVNDFKIDADNLELTIGVKDHAAEEPLGYNPQMTLGLLGDKGYATIRLYERGPDDMEGFVDWPSGVTSALNFAILDFSTWNSFSVEVQAGQLTVSAGGEVFTRVPTEGNLGQLLGLNISFSGSGSLDFVSIEDRNTNEAIRENFDVCDCERPGVNAKPVITSIHEKELRLALPTPLAPALRAQNDLIIMGELNGRYEGTLQREGKYLVFLSNQPFYAGEELNVTLVEGLLLADGTTSSKYTWKETVPARHVTDGQFFLAPLGIQLPSNALDYSYSFSTADFDQNGTMDVVFHYYTSYGAASNQLIYLRNHDGVSQGPVAYVNNRSHSSIQGTPDLNGDGYPDLLIRHNVPSSVMIRLNNGDGSFGTEQYYTVGSFTNGFAYGDLDADGDIDIISASGLSTIANNTFTILTNDGAGNFSTANTTTGIFNATRHLSDLDEDGDLDLVYTSSTSFNSPARFRIYENDGNGMLTLVVDQNNPENQHIRQIIDIDGDTHLDLLLTSPSDLVIYGDGTLNYDYTEQVSLGTERFRTTIMDIDADQDQDLLRTARYDGSAWLGPLQTQERQPNNAYSTWIGVDDILREGLRPVDFDADGDIDHVAVNESRELLLVENVDSAFYLDVELILAGAYQSSTGLMTDALRSGLFLPEVEPYGVDCRRALPGVFDMTGPTAIVDWVVLELRHGTDHTEVMRVQSALLRRDGRVVDVDGISPITFDIIPPDGYFLAVRHRNHLGVMTAVPSDIALRETVVLDFTDAQVTPAYGADALGETAGKMLLRSGDANQDRVVRYSDLFVPPFTFIPSDALSVFTFLNGADQRTGYHPQDINMDGVVRYSDLFIPPFTIVPSDALRIFNALDGNPSGQRNQQH